MSWRTAALLRSQNALAVLALVAGLAFGRGMSIIPSPHDYQVFWIGNLCAPWLALAFLAGLTQGTRLRALAVGATTEVACMVGFYAHFLFLGGPQALGLPAASPAVHYIRADLLHWLHFIAPWVAVALAAGLVYGFLGYWWKTSRPTAGAAALALPFISEPGLWHIRRPDLQQPWAIWALEVTVGLLAFAALLRHRDRSQVGTSI